MARNSVVIDIYLRLSIAKESKQLVNVLKLLMGNCKIKIQAIPILKLCNGRMIRLVFTNGNWNVNS